MKYDKLKIPESLWSLIPLAEEFGISDDGYRWDKIQNATPEKLSELKNVVIEYDDLFDDWLASSEALTDPFSNEYIAFSALRMASDEAN